MDRRCVLGVAVVISAGGCLSQVFPPARVYPGKANVTEALNALRPQAEAAVSFKTRGQCRIGYVNESGKARQFNLPVNIFVNPPSEVYLQGQATLGPQGMVFLGTNAEEFWLGLRPEISTFWWGEWSKAREAHDLPVSPRAVFESFGLAAVEPLQEDPNRWSLSSGRGQDILTWRDPNGRSVKRLFVDRGDYRVSRIEYLDPDGQVAVSVELKRYEKVDKAMWVPSRISIVAFVKGQRSHWARLDLESFMAWQRDEKFRKKYLVRPDASGFKRVIEVDGTDQEQ